jgi:hypothetical protein
MITALALRARKAQHDEVASALENIVAAERLLSPMEQLFSWIQGRNRETLAKVVAGIESTWGASMPRTAEATDDVLGRPILDVYGPGEVFGAFAGIRDALGTGDWQRAVEGVIDLNAMTMRRRGGDAWVKLEYGRLEVRLADEQAALPDPEEIERALLHSFYLDPLRRLIIAWEDGQHV